MDIYSFINSKAVANHCRRIKHQFNTIESAFFVQKSLHHTLSEKQRAFEEIIAAMPDMPFKRDHYSCKLDFDSFHEFLHQYMACENKALQSFKQADGCLYTYDYNTVGWGELVNLGDIFNNWESCLDYVIKKCPMGKKFIISKRQINPIFSEENKTNYKSQTVLFNKNKEPLSVELSWSATKEETEVYYNAFDSLWFEIPTPFTKGDIVYNPYRTYDEYPNTPFVFTDMCTPSSDFYKDVDEMNVNGFFVIKSTPTVADTDCLLEPRLCFDLEYYDKKLADTERILKPISSFLKDDIDVVLLLNAYIAITQEEEWKKSHSYKAYIEEKFEERKYLEAKFEDIEEYEECLDAKSE